MPTSILVPAQTPEQTKAARKAAVLAMDTSVVLVKIYGLERAMPGITERQVDRAQQQLCSPGLYLAKGDSGHPFYQKRPGICTATVLDQIQQRGLLCDYTYFEQAKQGVITTMVFSRRRSEAWTKPAEGLVRLMQRLPRETSVWGNLQEDLVSGEVVRVDSVNLNFATYLPQAGINGALAWEGREWLIK